MSNMQSAELLKTFEDAMPGTTSVGLANMEGLAASRLGNLNAHEIIRQVNQRHDMDYRSPGIGVGGVGLNASWCLLEYGLSRNFPHGEPGTAERFFYDATASGIDGRSGDPTCLWCVARRR